MDELVDIWDADSNTTGEVKLKSEAHRLGLFHPVVHIWCFSKSEKVLLQQRGKLKTSYPLKWDVSVAGHVGAGEEIKSAAHREAEEEIGVAIDTAKLKKIGIFKNVKKHSPSFIDREFTHTFLYELDEATQLTKQESEVESLEWMDLKEFEKLVSENDKRFVPNSAKRYTFIISEIRALI